MMGQRWMRSLLIWEPGMKHPWTPMTVFENVRNYDRVRRVSIGRCASCDITISLDEKIVKELVFVCKRSTCDCRRVGLARAHYVCSLCYDMRHAIYMNGNLKNMNYFRELDEKDKRDEEERKRREREKGNAT